MVHYCPFTNNTFTACMIKYLLSGNVYVFKIEEKAKVGDVVGKVY